ncbi:hypothetical protein [Streptomyces mangrovisoli]|uniref:hypothetical protein n=1 Tax=Streptomyces mangrovisoli TaxID=1428628 RepID=UPI000D19F7FD|nr:hypothetical protein [Streptomyces mangrovisoli]
MSLGRLGHLGHLVSLGRTDRTGRSGRPSGPGRSRRSPDRARRSNSRSGGARSVSVSAAGVLLTSCLLLPFRLLVPARAAHRRDSRRWRRGRRVPSGPPPHSQDELGVCRQELMRWQEYADSYAQELGRASRERAHLLAWLAALHPASAVMTPAGGAGQESGHCLCLMAGGWQMSWTVPQADLALFPHVPYAEQAVGRNAEEGVDQDARIRWHTHLLALEGNLHKVPAGACPPEGLDCH